MKLAILSPAIVVASSVLYHISQKSIPPGASSFASLTVAYLVAIGVSFLVLLFVPWQGGLGRIYSDFNWASVGLGFAVVGIEIGYLLLYRSGWSVGLGPVFCTAIMALILVPTGMLLYKEKLVLSNYIGIALSLAGVYLIIRR
ncbi:MAG: EamA family transporter [Candidatus Zixiibacteriota bacterium]|nr:MAG: EamA family transporter [candidate division Zixibacteria bacterium]